MKNIKTDLKDELYYDPINKVILCRKYEFQQYSIVSIAEYIDDTMTTICLEEIESHYFKKFIKIDYDNLYMYYFLTKMDSYNIYKNKWEIDRYDIRTTQYRKLEYQYKKNYKDEYLVKVYLKKDELFRKNKLKRIL